MQGFSLKVGGAGHPGLLCRVLLEAANWVNVAARGGVVTRTATARSPILLVRIAGTALSCHGAGNRPVLFIISL